MKTTPFLRLALALAFVPLACVSLRADLPAPTGIVSADARFQIPATDAALPGAGPMRRAEWFQNVWTQRRADFANHVADDQGAIVFLGDSITHGWYDVGSLFPGIKVANRGISGDTTRGVLYRLQDDVIALHPRAVVLLIGTNDLEEYAKLEDVAGNLKLILAALKAYDAKMPVILCRVFPSAAEKTRPVGRIRALNDLYATTVKDEPQVTLVDTWALFADVHGDAMADQFPDLLHPNGLGYARWAAALRPIMEDLGLVPAWPDDFAVEPGFESLFNGRDLTGWGYRGAAVFDGKTDSPDERYVVRNGRLIVTARRQDQPLLGLYTTKTFPKDFVLKLEFRASPNADSGIFVREPQLQCRDYTIAGPFTNLKAYRPLDWNEIEITVKGGLAHATCNGETIMDAMPVPADGPIGLESDRGPMEYRRIRIKSL